MEPLKTFVALSIVLLASAIAAGQGAPCRPCADLGELLRLRGLSPPAAALPAPGDHESAWSKYLAEQLGGSASVICWEGSRPDIVAGDLAIEVERAPKWKESLGQAFLYAAMTDRRPAVLILVDDLAAERDCLWRVQVAAQRAGVELSFFDMRRNRWILETRSSATDER